jgi:group I intron endonuclease
LNITQSGIYSITNLINGKRYIGSATVLRKRWNQHHHHLRRHTHANPHLQSAWTAYGSGAFRFEMLETCEPEVLLEREHFWITYFESQTPAKGYNLMPPIPTSYGYRRSEATRQKIAESLRGQTQSQETKDKRAKSNRGQKRSLQTRERMRRAQRSPEQIALRAMRWEVTSPDGEVLVITNLRQFSLDNGLTPSCMHEVAMGVRGRSQHKGWRARPYASRL